MQWWDKQLLSNFATYDLKKFKQFKKFKHFTNFAEKHLCWRLFLKKLQVFKETQGIPGRLETPT